MGITATSVYAPGDTITSAWANILRTNFGVLDSRTGDDPGAAGLMLVSDGATSAAWVDDNTAVINGIGYAPLRDTTDTLTGDLTVTGTASAAGVAVGASGVTITGAGLTATGAISPGSYAGGSTSAGSPSVLGLNVGTDGVASAGPTTMTTVTASGQISGGSYAGGSASAGIPSFLGAVIGASGLVVGAGGADINGPLTPDSYGGGSISTGAPSVLGLNVGTSGIAVSGQVASSVTTGTAPFTVASTTLVSNLNADLLDGLSSAAFSRIASGTYTGDGAITARQITTGWAAKLVLIHDSANDTMYVAVNTTNSIRLGPSPTFVQGSSSVHTHASDGFTVADGTAQGNVNTNTYSYTAFG